MSDEKNDDQPPEDEPVAAEIQPQQPKGEKVDFARYDDPSVFLPGGDDFTLYRFTSPRQHERQTIPPLCRTGVEAMNLWLYIKELLVANKMLERGCTPEDEAVLRAELFADLTFQAEAVVAHSFMIHYLPRMVDLALQLTLRMMTVSALAHGRDDRAAILQGFMSRALDEWREEVAFIISQPPVSFSTRDPDDLTDLPTDETVN